MANDETVLSAAPQGPASLSTDLAQARRQRERHKASSAARAHSHPLLRRRSPHYLVPRALRLSGLAARARRNALAVSVTENALVIPRLPTPFRGLRILHISDPHFGADQELDEAIVDSVRKLEHDLCVMTGDYRYRSYGPIEQTLQSMTQLCDALQPSASGSPALAVLGNHDSLDMVPPMEAMGIRILLNASHTLHRDGSSLHVVGIDDPRYYRTDDLEQAMATRHGVAATAAPDSGALAATILLAHSPERAAIAARLGCDAYLCGHTHGGQICLPGRRILMRNAEAPRDRLSGNWKVDEMCGFTSRGVGVSIATGRFNCPPEITLHTLQHDREHQ